jgi:hypothetical protein
MSTGIIHAIAVALLGAVAAPATPVANQHSIAVTRGFDVVQDARSSPRCARRRR